MQNIVHTTWCLNEKAPIGSYNLMLGSGLGECGEGLEGVANLKRCGLVGKGMA